MINFSKYSTYSEAIVKVACFFAMVSVLFAADSFAGSIGTVKVTFKTLSCGGTKGLASIDADSVVKVESIKCEPGATVPEVYQILVTGELGSGLKYRVFTTSEEEAARLMEKVEAYQQDKQKSIREGDRIIIDKNR